MQLCIFLASLVVGTYGQTWCGKHYMENSTVVEPGGEFPTTETSNEPLLSFRCAPAIKPYLQEDTEGSIIIDTQITHSKVFGTSPIKAPDSISELRLLISVNGHALASGSIPLNSTAQEVQISLESLTPQKEAFDIECTAVTPDGQEFRSNTTLLRLPDRNDGGSVTKMDSRTGALLVRDNKTGAWNPLFALGFYTSFSDYLATNLSVLNDLKERGFTIVHPVPDFDNQTALNEVLDRMEEVGLYLMYDMRFTYMNLTSVTEQVNMIKSRKNLLLWYTGDEPDGTSDPLNATTITYDLINELDGYHPVSLVLNCQNYFFPEYTAGTDVVMQDAYPISINATFSVEWHTPCTPDYGDCGCDNCNGDFFDISTRMDEFSERLDILGWRRTKTVWAVPQAFGGSEYWARAPTGNEWLVEAVLSINHGAKGIVPWIDPTPPDIKNTSTILAQALPTIIPFLFDPTVIFTPFKQNFIDAGLWRTESRTLLLAANLFNASATYTVSLPDDSIIHTTQVFSSGGSLRVVGSKMTLNLDPLGAVGFIIEDVST